MFLLSTGSLETNATGSWKSNIWTELTEDIEWEIVYLQGTVVDTMSTVEAEA